jgi:hypothetical protein
LVAFDDALDEVAELAIGGGRSQQEVEAVTW